MPPAPARGCGGSSGGRRSRPASVGCGRPAPLRRASSGWRDRGWHGSARGGLRPLPRHRRRTATCPPGAPRSVPRRWARAGQKRGPPRPCLPAFATCCRRGGSYPRRETARSRGRRHRSRTKGQGTCRPCPFPACQRGVQAGACPRPARRPPDRARPPAPRRRSRGRSPSGRRGRPSARRPDPAARRRGRETFRIPGASTHDSCRRWQPARHRRGPRRWRAPCCSPFRPRC